MPQPAGVLRLLNPLSIRFSQPRVAPHFRDGHLLEDTAAEVALEPLQDQPAFEVSADAAEGHPPYDLVVIPPFPAIRVISWLPKIRGADGEAERDSNGDQILGKRAWFALDNRRLWSLQTAAAKVWPRRCCAVVWCLEDVPGTTIRELRKFRTTTEGRCIEFGVRTGETTTWRWQQVAPAGAKLDEAKTDEESNLEGLFAEDLWDALQWAPLAAEKASERDPEDFVPRASSRKEREAEEYAAQKQAEEVASAAAAIATPARVAAGYGGAVPSNGGYSGYGLANLAYSMPNAARSVPQQTAPLAPGQTLLRAANAGFRGGRRGDSSACPESGWEYIDPQGRTQGPFERRKMRLWHEHNYFYPDLMMRCSAEDAFVPFGVLFPKPIEPFLAEVMRYKLQ